MSGTKILIVEDEGLVAEEIRSRLRNLGYEPAGVARSGPEALDLVRDRKPDLVLMDIRLQGPMDGVEAAAEIAAASNVPVVYLTAHTDRETLDRAKATSPYGYVVKPLEERELQVAVEMALYRHQAQCEQAELLRELETALAQVRTLQGLVPICASCKSVRDDQGYWRRIEDYISDNTDAVLDEALCPDCLRRAKIDVESIRARRASESLH